MANPMVVELFKNDRPEARFLHLFSGALEISQILWHGATYGVQRIEKELRKYENFCNFVEEFDKLIHP